MQQLLCAIGLHGEWAQLRDDYCLVHISLQGVIHTYWLSGEDATEENAADASGAFGTEFVTWRGE